MLTKELFDITPQWVASVGQVKQFLKICDELEIEPGDLFESVVRQIGEYRETFNVREKVWPQIEWLMEGRLLEHAPYVGYFLETSDYPFEIAPSYLKVEQKVVSIAEFFDDYLWKAVSELRALRNKVS